MPGDDLARNRPALLGELGRHPLDPDPGGLRLRLDELRNEGLACSEVERLHDRGQKKLGALRPWAAGNLFESGIRRPGEVDADEDSHESGLLKKMDADLPSRTPPRD